jgi:hypothetical protein
MVSYVSSDELNKILTLYNENAKINNENMIIIFKKLKELKTKMDLLEDRLQVVESIHLEDPEGEEGQ